MTIDRISWEPIEFLIILSEPNVAKEIDWELLYYLSITYPLVVGIAQ